MAKEKLKGNQNARKKGRYGSLVMRLDASTVDLIDDVLKREGVITEPTPGDIVEAAKMEVHMAFERRKGKALKEQEQK